MMIEAVRTPLSDAPELCRLGAAELVAGYRSRQFSPVDVARAVIKRAETINPATNAFTFLDHAGAIVAAEASEARWLKGEPLSAVDGVPTTLKDIVWVAGWSVRYGSATTSAALYSEDAPSVSLLRQHGAIFIGQTTTPEFGWKAVTDSALFGVTRNPWDLDKTPGGSSGGAAVAAACGAGVFHLGTDGGGSIRVPASFTGIVGLKPTFGRVPAYPSSAFGTVAHIGPMTRGVADAAAMLAAMSGRSMRDWAQGPGALAALDGASSTFRGARIGYWTTPPCGSVDQEITGVVDGAVKALETLGAYVEPINLPGSDHLEIFNTHWFSGAAARLDAIPSALRGGIDPGFLEMATTGARYTAIDLIKAQVRRAEFGAAMDDLLATYDFIVSPGTAVLPFGAGRELPDGSAMSRWTEWAGFSFPINLSQQPALIVPCGVSALGLPIGLQIIGARGREAQVLGVGRAFEQQAPRFWGEG